MRGTWVQGRLRSRGPGHANLGIGQGIETGKSEGTLVFKFRSIYLSIENKHPKKMSRQKRIRRVLFCIIQYQHRSTTCLLQ